MSGHNETEAGFEASASLHSAGVSSQADLDDEAMWQQLDFENEGRETGVVLQRVDEGEADREFIPTHAPFFAPEVWAMLEVALAAGEFTDDDHTPVEPITEGSDPVGGEDSAAEPDRPAEGEAMVAEPPAGTEPDEGFEGLTATEQTKRFFDYIGVETHGIFVFSASFESKGNDGKWHERWTHRRAQRRGTSGDANLADTLIYGSHTPSGESKGSISSWRKKKDKEDIRSFEHFLRTAEFKADGNGVISSYEQDAVKRRRTYFSEQDTDAGTLEQQRALVRELAAEGLLFNAILYSGGKSLHLHLTRPRGWESTLEQDRWIDQAICLLVLGDTKAQLLNQACRLPGSKRPGKHEQRLIGGRAETYSSYEELRSLLERMLAARGITDVEAAYAERKAMQTARAQKSAIETAANSELSREWDAWEGWSEGDKATVAALPFMMAGQQLLDLVPLQAKKLVLEGSGNGHRWDDGTMLTLNLRGAADVLAEVGIDAGRAVEEVLDLFCENSGGDVDRDRLNGQYAGAEGALPGRPVADFMNSLHFLTGGQLGERKQKELSAAQGETALGKLLAAIGPGEWGEDENGAPVRPDSLSVGQFAEIIDDLGQSLRWNEMRMAIEYENEEIKPHEVELIYVDLHKQDRYVTKNIAIDAILSRARKNGYDPARDYLDYLKKDDTAKPVNIDTIATNYLGTSDPLYDKMMKVMLLGAVDRRMRPGCKFDYVVVLKGEQGTKKSTFWQALASPDMHTSSMPDNDKDMLLNIHAVWVYELAELESITSKHDVGKLKNYITTPTDLLRVPYGKASEWRPRASVFVGTVNGDSFLRDETGERRFLVIDLPQKPACGEFLNIEAVVRDRDRIWKAALLALEAGDKPYLNHEDQIESDTRNEDYQQVDAWGGPLDKWLNPTEAEKEIRDTWGEFEDRPSVSEEFTTADALVGSGVRDLKNINSGDNVRMAKLLKMRGFVKNRKRINGALSWVWRRPEVA